VARVTRSRACRKSPRADRAATLAECSPSGSDSRQLKVPSARRGIGRPPIVTVASGSVAPWMTRSVWTRNQKPGAGGSAAPAAGLETLPASPPATAQRAASPSAQELSASPNSGVHASISAGASSRAVSGGGSFPGAAGRAGVASCVSRTWGGIVTNRTVRSAETASTGVVTGAEVAICTQRRRGR